MKIPANTSRSFFWGALLCIAVCSLGAGMSDLRRQQLQGDAAGEFWNMADTPVYFSNAEALKTGRPLGKMFRDRLLVPALLCMTGSSLSDPWPYLYLQQLPHFFIPLILAGIANLLFKNMFASVFCALLYLAYPPAREASRIVSTDFLHAFFAILAVHCTLRYWCSDKWRDMLFSATAWIFAMLSRPTFMWEWILIAPMSAWHVRKRHLRPGKAVCHVALLMAVPLFFALLNYFQCGVATPSFAAFENVHCSLVPSIQTCLRNQAGETERISKIFAEQVGRQKALRDNAWGTLELWQANKPDDRHAFARTYRQLLGDDKAYIRAHWRTAFNLAKSESGNLLFDSNLLWRGGSRVRNLFVLGAFAGLLFVCCMHGQRETAFWLFLTLGLAIGPASCAVQLWWGRRVGLPADFVLLALAGGVLTSWKRIPVLLFLCIGFKALNAWRYEPTLHLAIMTGITFAILECIGWIRHRSHTVTGIMAA